MDAGIQAMDGNVPVARGLNQAGCLFAACHPWTLDLGIHAEMTGYPAPP